MSSRFQTCVLVSSPCYPNAVVWSEENLVAIAAGNSVSIVNPARPGPRGVISIPASKRYPVGVIDGGWEDLLSGSFLPIYLSQDTRPCVRSISWSPLGLTKNAGCLLAVCTTSGSVKLFRFPFYEITTEWIEVLDIMELLYAYLIHIDFGESQITSPEKADVIGGRGTVGLTLCNLRKESKRRKKNSTNVAEKEPQKHSVSVSDGKPPEKAISDVNALLISVQQYASRIASLTPLVVAWSPVLRTSGYDLAIPHNPSGCSSILAVGQKCGRVSFWKIDGPECYSIENSAHSPKTSLVGLLKAHDTWVTSINWALYKSNVSESLLLLATGSSDGVVKIWQVNVEDLLQASEVVHASFTLLKEVLAIDSSPVSVLSVIVTRHAPPLKLLAAFGKGSGSLEVLILDLHNGEFERIVSSSAHDHIVTGLAWAFDGCCLYSCSQDNSMKSWVLVGNSLCEVNIPANSPGLKSSTDVPYVYDSCFGLAVSPGNLVIAAVHRFDSDLLNPMYQERTFKAAIEFLWIGGQHLKNFLPSDGDHGSFPEKDLICWETKILWSLKYYENLQIPLNVWDIVAALVSFKQSIPSFVDHILLKWLKSFFGSKFDIDEILKLKATFTILSSRQLQLINIITRHVVLTSCKTDTTSKKYQELERLGCTRDKFIESWMALLLSSENELRRRLVCFSFSVILSAISNSTIDLCKIGYWSPDEWPLLEHWISLNNNSIEDDVKLLSTEVGKIEKRRLYEIFKSEDSEHCSFCSAVVPFESTEYAICSGIEDDDGILQSHKLERCAVSMGICSTKFSWFCICCQRRSSKLAPIALFKMSAYPSDIKSFSSSACGEYSTLCCIFCGILLQRLQPEFLLYPSPI